MNFDEACGFLFSHVNYETQTASAYAPELFSLSRMRRLLACLGDPHERYPIIHIAGTKGKGSVAAMTESILRSADYRTGLYTSPHLCDLRERFRVGKTLISREDFAYVMMALRPHVEAIGEITFFEIATALALEWFARQQVSVAVLEVGLGGRLDATNVVTPAVCAVTSISFDHTNLLGGSLAEIAAEKGGIIKSGVPVVCAPQHPEALAKLEEAAAGMMAPFCLMGRDWIMTRRRTSHQGETLILSPRSSPDSETEYSVPLPGAHQVENAAVSVAIAEELRKQGWLVSAGAVLRGLQQVYWPARCQIVPGDPLIVVDCAHNSASAAALVNVLNERFHGNAPVLVFGSMQDKDIGGMLAKLLPVARKTIMTRSKHPRASDPNFLADRAKGLASQVSVAADLPEALEQALHAARDRGLVLVTGSVSLAGEAYIALRTAGRIS